MEISEDDVRRVAELANLDLTDAEQGAMRRDLGSILGYVAQLNELDTSEVPPMTQVPELLGDGAAQASESLRADRPQPSLERKAVLDFAPESDGTFFKVPKVIDR